MALYKSPGKGHRLIAYWAGVAVLVVSGYCFTKVLGPSIPLCNGPISSEYIAT